MRLAQKLRSIAEVIRQEEAKGHMASISSDKLSRWNTLGSKYAALAGAGKSSKMIPIS
jgi:hypothetical protein